MNYFVETVLDAQIDAEKEIDFTLKKSKFFDQHKNELNERHQKVVQRMLEEGYQGFEGDMNARKYVRLMAHLPMDISVTDSICYSKLVKLEKFFLADKPKINLEPE